MLNLKGKGGKDKMWKKKNYKIEFQDNLVLRGKIKAFMYLVSV